MASTYNPSKKKYYIVTSIFSPYKEDINPGSIDSYLFDSRSKAEIFMNKEAKEVYYTQIKSDEEDYDGNKTPPEEEENDGAFYYANKNCICFGEDSSMGFSYRRAWGIVKIEEVRMKD